MDKKRKQKEDKQNNQQMVLMFLKKCKGKQITAVIFAVISVLGSIVPYYCAFQIFDLFFSGMENSDHIVRWSLIAVAGFLVKAVCHSISTSLAHESAYIILENVRGYIADKLMKAPL